ncbi:hypothetical protein [Yinghuangia seranimata]|uniref:hypothetical protein n=1 Tax=Yinghuangia seranimata TaxID=408067 RepID=UPI00248BAF3B|nr:hypothetical protein [Yinghuangia seranimata]MDI2130209.1 hypothetical protein [Yinghuangia seranimata]
MTSTPPPRLRGTPARISLARRRDLPHRLVLHIARCGDRLLLNAVAARDELPPDVVAVLAECGQGDVVDRLTWRGLLDDEEEPWEPDLGDPRQASFHTEDPERLRSLAREADVDVRVAVAENEATPADVIAELYRWPDRPPFTWHEHNDPAFAAIRIRAARVHLPAFPARELADVEVPDTVRAEFVWHADDVGPCCCGVHCTCPHRGRAGSLSVASRPSRFRFSRGRPARQAAVDPQGTVGLSRGGGGGLTRGPSALNILGTCGRGGRCGATPRASYRRAAVPAW